MDDDPNLKRDPVLEQDIGFFGIPLQLFAFGVLFGMFGSGIALYQFGLVFGSLIGGAYLALVFMPLRIAHKDDLRAWLLWVENLKTPKLTSVYIEKKAVMIIHHSRVVTFEKWRKK